jgi:hypothetical protein
MRAIICILWFQLLVGLAAMYVSFAGLHTGAMGMEWSNRLQAEYARIRTSPDFHTPPEVMGNSYEKLLESLHSSERARSHNAGYCFFLSAGITVISVVLLWFAYRANRWSQPPSRLVSGGLVKVER